MSDADELFEGMNVKFRLAACREDLILHGQSPGVSPAQNAAYKHGVVDAFSRFYQSITAMGFRPPNDPKDNESCEDPWCCCIHVPNDDDIKKSGAV